MWLLIILENCFVIASNFKEFPVRKVETQSPYSTKGTVGYLLWICFNSLWWNVQDKCKPGADPSVWIRSVPPSTRRTSWPSTWPRPSTRKRLARTVKSGSTITISRKWQKFKRFYEEVQDHLQLALQGQGRKVSGYRETRGAIGCQERGSSVFLTRGDLPLQNALI